jgi:hypothetical protein
VGGGKVGGAGAGGRGLEDGALIVGHLAVPGV